MDIFFSYSSKDRARVQPLRDALADYGFSVFWDQEVPANTDWDTWIRKQLNEATCALVVWSVDSIASDNVRHEAFIAKRQNKLIPVMVDLVEADRLPMGLYAVQVVNLSSWTGDPEHEEWKKLLRELESKLAPAWVKVLLDRHDAELHSERTRRESAERRDRTLRQQIAKEADARQALEVELAHARDEITRLTTGVNAAQQQRADAVSRATELSKQVATLTTRLAEMDKTMQSLEERLRGETSQQRAKRESPAQERTQSSQRKTVPAILPAELLKQLETFIQRGAELRVSLHGRNVNVANWTSEAEDWNTEVRKWLSANFPIGAHYDFDSNWLAMRNVQSDKHEALKALDRQVSLLNDLKKWRFKIKH